MKKLLILIVAALIISCNPGSNITKTMESWIGQPSNQLKLSWGPPTYSVDFEFRVAWVYKYTRQGRTIPGIAAMDKYGVIHYTNPQTQGYGVKRTFYISKKTDRVVGYSWKGL